VLLKTFYTPYIFIVFFLFITVFSNAQSLELNLKSTSKTNTNILKNIDYKRLQDSKSDLLDEINNIKIKLAYQGFFNTKLDSIVLSGNRYTAYLNLGRPIKSINIKYNTLISLKILKKYTTVYNDSSFTIKFKYIEPLLNNLSNNFETQGRSFTQLKLKNISFKNGMASADLAISKTEQRRITEIVLKNYKNFPKTFLRYYLNIKKNDIFNKAKIKNVSRRIKYLNFVTEIKPAEVLFTKNKTNLYLYLKKTKINTVDGLLGFSSKENGQGLLFNGYLNLNLVNTFNTGETLSLLFKNNGLSQQKFNIGANLPYIFKTKITLNAYLNIYKQDSSYVNINSNFVIQYPINYNNNIGLSINNRSSVNLLTNNTGNIVSYNTAFFGLNFNHNLLSNDLNFDKILSLQANVSIGTKKTGNTKTKQYILNLTASYILPFNYKNAIFFKNNSAFLSSKSYLTNELFRLGGYNSIRGFKEESIFASKYSILNIEYRHKTNKASYLYSITDFGVIINPFLPKKLNLYSFGIGYKFLAKMGIVNLSYVLGKSGNQPLKIKNSLLNINIKSKF